MGLFPVTGGHHAKIKYLRLFLEANWASLGAEASLGSVLKSFVRKWRMQDWVKKRVKWNTQPVPRGALEHTAHQGCSSSYLQCPNVIPPLLHSMDVELSWLQGSGVALGRVVFFGLSFQGSSYWDSAESHQWPTLPAWVGFSHKVGSTPQHKGLSPLKPFAPVFFIDALGVAPPGF
jgi:hypothetical protein